LILGKASVDLGPIRNLGPSLYDWKDDGEFAAWLWEHPVEDHETLGSQMTNVITTSLVDEQLEMLPDVVTLVDEVEYEAIYT